MKNLFMKMLVNSIWSQLWRACGTLRTPLLPYATFRYHTCRLSFSKQHRSVYHKFSLWSPRGRSVVLNLSSNSLIPRSFFSVSSDTIDGNGGESEEEEEDGGPEERVWISVPKEKLNLSFARSSGPGGQNVNKLNTKVDLRFHVESCDWIPEKVKRRFLEQNKNAINRLGEFHLQSEKTRTQESNVKDALAKLQHLIDTACVIPKKRIATKVPQYAIEKRKEDKKKRSEKKEGRRSGKIIF